jgi:2-iminobutanoate/2-iminopropanoate deaminase
MKKIIETGNAPSPIGPYSQAVHAGNLLFISGQIAIVPASNELYTGEIEHETKQVMENLKHILFHAGASFDNVIKTTIFLKSMSLFGDVNKVYGSYFTNAYPARETVAVSGLPKDANVEISMVAML